MKDKNKFRASKQWKEFRKKLSSSRKTDELTLSPLRKGFNVHHLDLNKDNYCNLENEDNFCVLNKKTHDVVHFLYTYYRKDKNVLKRLEYILEKMCELNT